MFEDDTSSVDTNHPTSSTLKNKKEEGKLVSIKKDSFSNSQPSGFQDYNFYPEPMMAITNPGPNKSTNGLPPRLNTVSRPMPTPRFVPSSDPKVVFSRLHQYQSRYSSAPVLKKLKLEGIEKNRHTYDKVGGEERSSSVSSDLTVSAKNY